MTWEQLSLLGETDAAGEDTGTRGPSPLAMPCCPDCGEPLTVCGDCGVSVCFGCRTGERLTGCALPRCDDCLGWYDEGLNPEALDVLLGSETFGAWVDKDR